jgi:beta-galactosidase
VKITYEMSKRGRRRSPPRKESAPLDIDDPYLYTVDVEGERVRYGIRMIGFYPDERGFQLNGRRVQLQGVCLHHDFGVLGAAYNHATMKRRLLLLKEAGVNAIRSSHNQSDPDLLDLCDELGLLFKNEHVDQWSMKKHGNDYHRLFDRWAERDLRAFMRCDRNHPCVILWSLGNEITESHRDLPLYTKNARFLNRIAHEEDTTRPTCCANDSQRGVDTNDYVRVTDVFGYNYQPVPLQVVPREPSRSAGFRQRSHLSGLDARRVLLPVQTNYLHSVKREANER